MPYAAPNHNLADHYEKLCPKCKHQLVKHVVAHGDHIEGGCSDTHRETFKHRDGFLRYAIYDCSCELTREEVLLNLGR